MLRVVLAAILTVAVVGVAFPAVENAEASRMDQLTSSEVTRLADAISALERENVPVTNPSAAARTVHTVSIPTSSLLPSESADIAIGGVPGAPRQGDTPARDLIAYRVGDGTYYVRWVMVDLRIDSETAGEHDPLVLSGTQELTLSLRIVNGEPLVVITRGS